MPLLDDLVEKCDETVVAVDVGGNGANDCVRAQPAGRDRLIECEGSQRAAHLAHGSICVACQVLSHERRVGG